jgi:NADPH-dependent ferric siderophore reductase
VSRDAALFELVRAPGLRVRMLEVVRVASIAPRMRRITLGGRDLGGFTSLAPEDHVKVFFPRPGEARPVVPTVGPDGVVPPPGDKPIGRDYTPRRHDPGRGELDIDFFLHGAGVAARWAAAAQPGDVVGVAGPRGSLVLERQLDWQLSYARMMAITVDGRYERPARPTRGPTSLIDYVTALSSRST